MLPHVRGLAVILAAFLFSGCVAGSTIVGRYPDGIPSSFDGQPVLRGAAVLAKAKRMTTADTFLVGTWLDVYTGPRSCPIEPRSLPPDSWLHACQPAIQASDEAGAEPSVLLTSSTATPTATFWFATGLHSGAAIVRVHVHDPRAAQCGPDEATCAGMMVVESAVWTGDSTTEPRPLSVASAQAAVEGAVPGLSLHLLGEGDMRSGPGLADAHTLQQPLPAQPTPTWPPPSQDGTITSVNILPSVGAVGRALPKVTSGLDGALLPSAVFSGQGWSGPGGSAWYDERWLVVENVAVSVLTLPTPSTADRALIARLVDALEGATATASPAP
jgi:hypothetical protein